MRRRLGTDGPEVCALGLGCMSFAGAFGETTEAESFAALDRARDMGIDFLDTANIYGPHRSEEVLGRWMASRGVRPVIATKAGIQRDPDRPVNNDPAHLEAELDGSLKRLGLDHVDLYYIHRHEASVPIEEVAEFMGTLIAKGKIGGWGMSEISPTTLRRAHAVTPVRAVQNEYSLWTRQPELGLVQDCARLGVAFVAFSPLARGVLGTDPFDVTSLKEGDFRHPMPRFQPEHWPQNAANSQAFRDHARAKGTTAPALALAWLMAQGDHVIPIPASRTAAHVSDWADALTLDLGPEDLAEIDAILPVGWAWGDRYSDQQARTPERYC